MKKACFSFLGLIYFCTTALTQTIQYSRQTFPSPFADGMQLVANISGNHHLVCFTAKKQPAVYIFDAQLQLKEQKKIGSELKEDCDVRILPFEKFYLLYVHSPNSSQHSLWKIEGDGATTDLSVPFQNLVDSFLKTNTSTLQLVRQNNNILIVAHTYYDGIKKMGSTVMQVTEALAPLQTRKVLYNFTSEETLQQVALAGNYLLLLKTGGDAETGYTLDVIKANLETGVSVINSFNTATHLYDAPGFHFSARDSSLLVYSLIREPVNSMRSQRTLFMVRLNFDLQELAPPSLFKSQFRNNTATNFLLWQGASPLWLSMNNSVRIRRAMPRSNIPNDYVAANPSTLNLRRYMSTNEYLSGYNQISGVRFTLLNEKLKLLKDSLVANNGNFLDVQPQPFAQFTMSNKACLLLVQNFSSKHRGLLMVSNDSQGLLQTSDIRVFDRYEYLLPQLQTVGSTYFILPYTYKSEIGLVKVTME